MSLLGAFVLRERRMRGWTQEKLEEQSGVPQPTISAIENGQETTSLAHIKRLADAFGARPGYVAELAMGEIVSNGNGTKSGARWVREVPRSLFVETAGDVEAGLSPEARAKLRRIEEVEGPQAAAEIREILCRPWITNAEAIIDARWRGLPPGGDGSG
jgi:transcriptional regulator with XRE-family HTH domain